MPATILAMRSLAALIDDCTWLGQTVLQWLGLAYRMGDRPRGGRPARRPSRRAQAAHAPALECQTRSRLAQGAA